MQTKLRFLENYLFSATLTEWNDLDYCLRNAPPINVFKQNNLKFISFGPNNIINIYNSHGLKLLTRLQLDLSHLPDHKLLLSLWSFYVWKTLRWECPNTEFFLVSIFSHFEWIRKFSPYTWKYGPEKTPYLNYLYAVKYIEERKDNSSRIKFVILTAHFLTKTKTLSVILFFSVKWIWIAVNNMNAHILNATIEYALPTGRFNILLFE